MTRTGGARAGAVDAAAGGKLGPRPGPRQAQLQAGDCIQGRIARDLAGSDGIAAAPTPSLGTGLILDPWKIAALTVLVRAPGQRCELWREPVLGAGRSTIHPGCDIGLLIHGVVDPSAPSCSWPLATRPASGRKQFGTRVHDGSKRATTTLQDLMPKVTSSTSPTDAWLANDVWVNAAD